MKHIDFAQTELALEVIKENVFVRSIDTLPDCMEVGLAEIQNLVVGGVIVRVKTKTLMPERASITEPSPMNLHCSWVIHS